MIVASRDGAPAGGCTTSGLEKVRLSDSQKTCLLPLYWGETRHVSIRNTSGWVATENTDENSPSTADVPAPTTPVSRQQRWGVDYNEVILVKLDGSQAWRLAPHRSRRVDVYWHQTRVAMSREGQYLVFDSNFRLSPTASDTDVYLIKLR